MGFLWELECLIRIPVLDKCGSGWHCGSEWHWAEALVASGSGQACCLSEWDWSRASAGVGAISQTFCKWAGLDKTLL